MNERDVDLSALRRMQAGDTSGLEELYDRYTGLLLGVTRRILRADHDSEEAVQEAWIYAWKSCGRFDAQRSSVAGWLVMIARSRGLDRYRSLSSRRRAEEQAPAPDAQASDDPSRLLQGDQLRQRVARALDSLDPNHRRVIETAFFEGLSHSQIATRFDKPLGTVKYWIREGLKQLGDALPQEDWR